jgi:hypothetical protein
VTLAASRLEPCFFNIALSAFQVQPGRFHFAGLDSDFDWIFYRIQG